MNTHSSTMVPDAQLTFEKAMHFHQQGRLAEAEELFFGLIQHMPRHAEALRLLGVVSLQTGRAERGLEWVERSLAIAPDNPVSHSNRGLALCDLKRLDEAIESFARAVALKPDYASAYSNLGIAYSRLKRFEEAVDSYTKAIAITPELADAHNNLGAVLRQLGRFEEAAASCGKAIALRSQFVAAYINGAGALMSLGRTAEAQAYFSQAAALRPDSAEAHKGLADALQAQGQASAAADSYAKAVSLDPCDPLTWCKYGDVLRKLERAEEAVRCYDEAIALDAAFAETHGVRGMALASLQRHAEALDSFDVALKFRPDFFEALSHRGKTLMELKRYQEAEVSCRQALKLRPQDATAHSNLAAPLFRLQRYEEAIVSCDTAIQIQPALAQAYCNRALTRLELDRHEAAESDVEQCLLIDSENVEARKLLSEIQLRRGQFEQGWRNHEYRKHVPGALLNVPGVAWTGTEDVAGRTIFLYAEQGLGDALQFVRYARLVRQRGANVVVAVHTPLLGLLKQSEPDITFTAFDQAPRHYDFHCALMSLPLAFGTKLDTIPAETPYLAADPATGEQWSRRLPARTRPRIGLAWSGSAENKLDYKRSMLLQELVPIFSFPADWYVLQKGIRPVDSDTLAQLTQIVDFGDELGDFACTAALMDQLDLIITVDTSLAHLAGALGRPVWIMLPNMPDWRWLLKGEHSPWYPSARLFRQAIQGDWASVVARIKDALAAHAWSRAS